jgi:hypothetical protein
VGREPARSAESAAHVQYVMTGINIELIKEALRCNSAADMELIYRPKIVDVDTSDGLAQLRNAVTNGF